MYYNNNMDKSLFNNFNIFNTNMFWNIIGKTINILTKPEEDSNESSFVDYYRLAKTNSYSSKTRKLESISWIIIHFTGGSKDTAKNNVDFFATGNKRYAGAHYFVDKNEICQSIDDNKIAWAVGDSGKGTLKNKVTNSNSISIELCSFNTYNKEVEIKAIEATKQIMNKYNIDKEHIVRHFDVTGKKCPLPYVEDELLWNKFKKQLTESSL